MAGKGLFGKALLTPLNQDDEFAFQLWYADTANRLGLDKNPDSPEHAYDYRGFWKAMQANEPAASMALQNDGAMHFTSPWKQQGHPTYDKKVLNDYAVQAKYSPMAANEMSESFDRPYELAPGLFILQKK